MPSVIFRWEIVNPRIVQMTELICCVAFLVGLSWSSQEYYPIFLFYWPLYSCLHHKEKQNWTLLFLIHIVYAKNLPEWIGWNFALTKKKPKKNEINILKSSGNAGCILMATTFESILYIKCQCPLTLSLLHSFLFNLNLFLH